MSIIKIINSWYKRIVFHSLSIQQRLPLLIYALLCSVILTVGVASYNGGMEATVEMGKKGLRTLTDQPGIIFTQSSQTTNTLELTVAGRDTIMHCIR